MIFFRFWLQVSLYSGLLMLIYFIVLRNRNAHTVSRGYLLVVSILPLLLPFIDLSLWLPAGNTIAVQWLREVVVGTGSDNTIAALKINWWYVYISVSAILLMVFAIKVIALSKRISNYKTVNKEGVNIIYNAPYTGSWLHYLLLEPQVTDPAIIAHEAAHIQHRHSYDLVFINVVGCFTWLNPFFFLLRKELRMVHEFQADEAALTGVAEYANTLMRHVFKTNTHSFIHTFSQHPLKRRIMMLHEKNRPRKTGYRLAVAGTMMLTIVSAGIFLQSCNNKASVLPTAKDDDFITVFDPTNGKTSKVKVVETKEDSASLNLVNTAQPLAYAEVMPHFNGSIAQYLSGAIKYPEEAKVKKIEGKVIVGFVVDVDGHIKDAEIKKSVNTLLSVEALRVIKNMPPWKPGMQDGKPVAVMYYQPITFRLE